MKAKSKKRPAKKAAPKKPRPRVAEQRSGMSWDRADVTVFENGELAMLPGVNFYRGEDGDVWWRIISHGRNREILDASTEGFRRLAGAQKNLRRTRDILNDA